MTDKQYILVIRLSAMGDVALSLPVLRSADTGNYGILMLTRTPFAGFFSNIEGLEVFRADTGGRHKGLAGIIRLYRDINSSYRIRMVLDLHSVLRSWVLGLLYLLKGAGVYRIDKGRKAKRDFIKHRQSSDLPHTVDRYRDVFLRAGFRAGKPVIPAFSLSGDAEKEADKIIAGSIPEGHMIVAVSPFAKHRTKMWPSGKMKSLMSLLTEKEKVFFLLFGGREEEVSLALLAGGFDNSLVVAGKYDLQTELALISRVSFMISMDSSNMHMAALSGIPTVSIWGGTHPDTGFGPVGTQAHLQIGLRLEDPDCRPCTVFGKGDCIREDIKYRCLEDISPDMVYNKMKGLMF